MLVWYNKYKQYKRDNSYIIDCFLFYSLVGLTELWLDLPSSSSLFLIKTNWCDNH